jgi:hypothetical protein
VTNWSPVDGEFTRKAGALRMPVSMESAARSPLVVATTMLSSARCASEVVRMSPPAAPPTKAN